MATAYPTFCIGQIGETAGIVWKVLSDKGPMTLTKLVKAVGEPRDNVMQAIGWLAREDKLVFEGKGRSCKVALNK
ncbi:MAG: winged helix-turn-helix domain-containing protein [Thermoguttaceae bacterium]